VTKTIVNNFNRLRSLRHCLLTSCGITAELVLDLSLLIRNNEIIMTENENNRIHSRVVVASVT